MDLFFFFFCTFPLIHRDSYWLLFIVAHFSEASNSLTAAERYDYQFANSLETQKLFHHTG